MPKLKSVIFDMDGVLVNTEPVHRKMYQRLLRDCGKELEDAVYAPCIGSTAARLQELVMEAYGIDILTQDNQRKLAQYEAEILEAEGYDEIPGMSVFIKKLKESGFTLAVASSSPYQSIVRTINDIGMSPYFDYFISGADVPCPKPAPDVFLKAMEKLGAGPKECVIVEDSANGVLAAKAAGAACIGFYNPDSGNQDLSRADIIVEGFEELDPWFVEKIHHRSNGLPVTIFEDEEFRLREMKLEDAKQIESLCAQNGGEAFLEDFASKVKERGFLENYIHSMYPFYDFGIYVLEQNGRLIGLAGLDIQEKEVITLGYLVASEEQGKGYARKAGEAILDYGEKRLGLRKVKIQVQEGNIPSMRTALRLVQSRPHLAEIEIIAG